jgi:hypothetical protein
LVILESVFQAVQALSEGLNFFVKGLKPPVKTTRASGNHALSGAQLGLQPVELVFDACESLLDAGQTDPVSLCQGALSSFLMSFLGKLSLDDTKYGLVYAFAFVLALLPKALEISDVLGGKLERELLSRDSMLAVHGSLDLGWGFVDTKQKT